MVRLILHFHLEKSICRKIDKLHDQGESNHLYKNLKKPIPKYNEYNGGIRIIPLLIAGIGWIMVNMALMVSLYYNMIVGWAIIYIYKIVTGQSYQWSSCENDFNTICKYFGMIFTKFLSLHILLL